jgi:hypothetical protein
MGHADAVSAVWFAVLIAVCGLLTWLGYRIEPHWVSKDGRRFMCNAQRLTARGEPETRWRETRIIINDTDQVQVDEKHFLRRSSTFWKVLSRSETPPRGREVFVLSGVDEAGVPALLALRLPKRSRAVTVLQQLISP